MKILRIKTSSVYKASILRLKNREPDLRSFKQTFGKKMTLSDCSSSNRYAPDY